MEKSFLQLILNKLMFAEKSVIFIFFQIKDGLYKKIDDGDGVINLVCLL